MNKDIIKGKWKEIKGQLKQQWGKLTDNEISCDKRIFSGRGLSESTNRKYYKIKN